MEPLWVGETKVPSKGHGHMTKMGAMSIYGKILKTVFSRPEQRVILKLGKKHWVLEYYQFPSNDDPRLTFGISTQMSFLLPYAFV